MKCFEIIKELRRNKVELKLTVNMKCFEIIKSNNYLYQCNWLTVNMKCFEISSSYEIQSFCFINRKHEMFLNASNLNIDLSTTSALTVNMKCF